MISEPKWTVTVDKRLLRAVACVAATDDPHYYLWSVQLTVERRARSRTMDEFLVRGTCTDGHSLLTAVLDRFDANSKSADMVKNFPMRGEALLPLDLVPRTGRRKRLALSGATSMKMG